MTRRLSALAALAAFVLGGCQATGKSESGQAKPGDLKPAPARITVDPGPKPEGRFFAVVGGETSNDNRLYQLSFSPPDLKLLTEAARVSSVGACDSRVVVAAGQQEVGFSDHLQELRGDRLVPLDGLGPLAAFNPQLGPDCRVAYTWVDRTAQPLADELRVWDPVRKTGGTLYRSKPGDGPLVSPDWGPNGEVAVVRLNPKQAGEGSEGNATSAPAAIIVARPDGSTTELSLGGDPGTLAWGRKWMAVMEEGQRATVFIDPSSGARSVLAGWRPVTWSPDGDRLLVKDLETKKTLGIVQASNLSSVMEVARVSGPVLDVDWLAP